MAPNTNFKKFINHSNSSYTFIIKQKKNHSGYFLELPGPKRTFLQRVNGGLQHGLRGRRRCGCPGDEQGDTLGGQHPGHYLDHLGRTQGQQAALERLLHQHQGHQNGTPGWAAQRLHQARSTEAHRAACRACGQRRR